MKSKVKPKLILDYMSSRDTYSDGDKVEEELLDIFKCEKPEKRINTILSNNPSWPHIYHLSPQRENLLSWFDFKKDSNLLEVGAGCGVLTKLFCDKVKKVTAVEISKRRSEIIVNRYRDCENLTVIVGNINNMKLNKTFDYITLIGVFEYAGIFTDTQDPFLDFLSLMKKYLKKNGTLIIAIENKFGLKYWAGIKEDHTSRLFDSIENYPEQKKIQTFAKKEIIDMLRKAEFEQQKFYYPLPDYKLPIEIFSDEYLPTLRHNIRRNIFPVVDLSQPRESLFDEKLVFDNVIDNDHFDFFANSFLIFAS